MSTEMVEVPKQKPHPDTHPNGKVETAMYIRVNTFS